jgi:hypothetical protein
MSDVNMSCNETMMFGYYWVVSLLCGVLVIQCPSFALVLIVFYGKKWLMDWLVLDWNVIGLNDRDKRLVVYNKIDESNCFVICLQETKCAIFDHSFIRSFYPKNI